MTQANPPPDAEAFTPKYRQVSDKLRDEIAGGAMAAGDRLPDDAALMDRFAVSRGTLLRALEALRDDGLLERVPGRGSFVRKPRSAPLALEGRRVMCVFEGGGLATHDTIFGTIEHFAAIRLRERAGMALVPRPVGLSLDPVEARRRLVEEAVAAKVDGLLYLPLEGDATGDENERLLRPARSEGIPVVLLDRDLVLRPARSDLDVVGTDNRVAGGAVGRHLIDCGCEHLLFVAPRLESSTVSDRIAGVSDAIARAGREVRLTVAPAADVDPPTPRDDGIRRALAKHRPDAVIAKDDRTAVAVLRVLYERQVRVPDDVRVASFDDAPIAADAAVPLTSYRQPVEAIADLAAEQVIRRIAGEPIPPMLALLTGRLKIRGSTQIV